METVVVPQSTLDEILRQIGVINQKQNFLLTKSFNFQSLKEQINDNANATIEELQEQSTILEMVEKELDAEIEEEIRAIDAIKIDKEED